MPRILSETYYKKSIIFKIKYKHQTKQIGVDDRLIDPFLKLISPDRPMILGSYKLLKKYRKYIKVRSFNGTKEIWGCLHDNDYLLKWFNS